MSKLTFKTVEKSAFMMIEFEYDDQKVYLAHWRPGTITAPTPGGLQYCRNANGDWDLGSAYSLNHPSGAPYMEDYIYKNIDSILEGDLDTPIWVISTYILHATARLGSYGAIDYSRISNAIATEYTNGWFGKELVETINREILKDIAALSDDGVKERIHRKLAE